MVLTMGVLLLFLWLLSGVLVLLWAAGQLLDPGPAPAPADPYAADVATFRAELHDWDRRGRP